MCLLWKENNLIWSKAIVEPWQNKLFDKNDFSVTNSMLHPTDDNLTRYETWLKPEIVGLH